MARAASLYAPIQKHGTQPASYAELASWQSKPGVWFAGGDFNTNLVEDHPCSGHFGHPVSGTWRTSVKHPWYCAALRPSGMVEALCIEVTSQHAPVLCHTIGQILREFKLSWQRPRVFSSSWTSWTSSLDEAFCAAISQGVFGSSVRLASVERNRLSDKPTARFCLGIA